jgi:UDP-N-acetylmuramyl pentapeptide synthase
MFNVANAMAAAGAAFALGTGLHEIRQGLRTFTTSYYLSPGRMNLVDVHNVEVIVDYCHNAPGMRVLGDFVERYAAHKARSAELGKMSRIGMIATPATDATTTCASSAPSRPSTSTSWSSARTRACVVHAHRARVHHQDLQRTVVGRCHHPR